MKSLLQGSQQGDLEAVHLFSVCPVTVTQVPPDVQYPLGGMNFEHKPIPFKLLKDLKQACAQYRVNSPYTTGLVLGMSQAERLIPWDWEMLARTVLSSAEYLQFKIWWSDEAMQRAHQNANQQPPIAITTEQLTGIVLNWVARTITV